MSFFDVTVDVSPGVEALREIRSKVAAIREPIFEEVHGVIHDAVVNDVEQLIAPAPGPSQQPFEFMSTRSANWYLWMKRTGQIPGQDWNPSGGEWGRNENLESSWTVAENTSANESFFTIQNDAQDFKGDYYAQAVYGPDPVPGFENTGWGRDIDDALDKMADHVEDMLYDALDRAIAEFNS